MKNLNTLEETECFNNILIINSSTYRAGHFSKNKEGDIIVEYSTVNQRLFFGLKKSGKFYYENEPHYIEKYIPNITLDEKLYGGRYESANIFVSTKNDINKTKEYLFSLSSYKTLFEIYDIEKDLLYYNATENIFTNGIYSYQFSLFESTIDNLNTYFCIYTHDNEVYSYDKGNYFSIKKFYFYENDEGNVDIELAESSNKKLAESSRIISGFLGKDRYIYVIYLSPGDNIYIDKYNFDTLILTPGKMLVGGCNLKIFRTLYLKDSFFSLIYFYSKANIIFKILNIASNYNYIIQKYIDIDMYPEIESLNDFLKINDERLLFITAKNNKLNLLFIDLYDNYQFMKSRFYTYTSSNYHFDKELSGFIYNDYLIFTITAIKNELCYNNYNSFLMIFGYANGTDDKIDFLPYLSDTDLFDININLVNMLLNNLTIENNIFGYENNNTIKLINIPEELKIYNGLNEELKNGDILDNNYILKQNKEIIKYNNYYFLEYQYIVKEPDYEAFYNNANQKLDDTGDFSYYFTPKIFYGRTNTLKFKLCHEYCNSCKIFGTNNNDQKCLSCLEEYQYDYFNISINNCVPEGYFYDNEINQLIKCDKETYEFKKEEKTNKTFCFPKIELIIDSTINKYSEDYTNINTVKSYLNLNTFSEISKTCSYNDFINKNCNYSNLNNYQILKELIPNLIETYPKINGESIIIKGRDNITFHITTEENELNTLNCNAMINQNLSVIDLSECSKKLKEKKIINPNDTLIILIVEKETQNIPEKKVQYEIYDPVTKNKIDLSICPFINLNIPIILDENTQNSYYDLKTYGYDLFDINDNFYQDICTPYKSKEGTDILLSDRQIDFYNINFTCQDDCKYSSYAERTKFLICECCINNNNITLEIFAEFVINSFKSVIKTSNFKFMKCYKLVFSSNSFTKNYGSIILLILILIHIVILIIYIIKGMKPLKIEIIKMIQELVINHNNIEKFEKIEQIPNRKRKTTILKSKRKSKATISAFKQNFGKSSRSSVSFFNNDKIINKDNINGNKNNIKDKNNSKGKNNINNNKGKNNNKNKDKDNNNKNDNDYKINLKNKRKSVLIVKGEKKVKDINNELNPIEEIIDINLMDEYDLNNLNYKDAIKIDKRTFIQIFCSMVRKKHIIIFVFYTKNDYNLIYLKFSNLVFLIATNFAMNVLFFFDESVHKIYSTGFNFIQHIPQIIYSVMISVVIEFIISFLIMSEGQIHEIKNNKNIHKDEYKDFATNLLKIFRIKFMIYFILTFAVLIFYWYFVSSFCAVYENTQVIFIEDTFTSFGLSLLYPFIKFFIFTLCRIISLRYNKDSTGCKLLYKLGVF